MTLDDIYRPWRRYWPAEPLPYNPKMDFSWVSRKPEVPPFIFCPGCPPLAPAPTGA